MRITKFGHSCVRLSVGGHDVVIDPGGWSEREAVEGVSAVFITHEHPDHWTAEHLLAASAPVYTIEAVAKQIRAADAALAERLQVVGTNTSFEVAGFAVRSVGEFHAIIHPEMPLFHNTGFVFEAEGTSLFHPGDSFELPGQDVDVFCAPVCAPWAKMSEVLDLARDVAAPKTLGIHDRIYSAEGLALVDGRMEAFVGQVGGTYARLSSGQDL